MQPARGRLFVISGPSGVGKGSVVAGIIAADPQLERSISCTTRARREGEEEGREYHFLTREAFGALIDEGGFLEWADVFDHRYGTLRSTVEQARDAGRDVVLEIDVQGAKSVQDLLHDDAAMIFLMPPEPAMATLEWRLDERNTEGGEDRTRRLAKAEAEMAQRERFDHIVVNDDLERARSEVAAIIESSRT